MSRQTRRAYNQQRRRGRMGVLIGVLAVVVVVLGVAALASTLTPGRQIATDAAAPGRLVVEQPTVDLGRVPFDQLVEARFALDNTGGDIVRLVGAPKVRMLEGC